MFKRIFRRRNHNKSCMDLPQYKLESLYSVLLFILPPRPTFLSLSLSLSLSPSSFFFFFLFLSCSLSMYSLQYSEMKAQVQAQGLKTLLQGLEKLGKQARISLSLSITMQSLSHLSFNFRKWMINIPLCKSLSQPFIIYINSSYGQG